MIHVTGTISRFRFLPHITAFCRDCLTNFTTDLGSIHPNKITTLKLTFCFFSRHTIIIKECIDLLEKFAKTERFAEMFWEQAKVLPKTNHERIFYDPAVQMLWNEIIKRVISLPDRVSNIYKLQSGSILWPECFFKILGKMIIKVLKLVHATISGKEEI